MFDTDAFDAHESVTFVSDAASGLRAVIAIHSTHRGPAFGGCRAWTYATPALALNDALRLSRGMSYKNAMAGLPFGGGKAVIIRADGQAVTDAQFEAFGRAVNDLGGRYITAEDVGVSVRSMELVARHTRYVGGLPHGQGANRREGDPSPLTALGVFCGIQSAVRAKLGRSDLKGLRVAVQGLGNVGMNLCGLLHEAGARLIVADLNTVAVESALRRFGAEVATVEEILFQDVDVVSPCALGGVFHARSIPQLKTTIIAGGANNQLATDTDGQSLHDRGILYAPDYVINAGGIIWVSAEYLGEFDESGAVLRVRHIRQTLDEIFLESATQNLPTNAVSDARARKLLLH